MCNFSSIRTTIIQWCKNIWFLLFLVLLTRCKTKTERERIEKEELRQIKNQLKRERNGLICLMNDGSRKIVIEAGPDAPIYPCKSNLSNRTKKSVRTTFKDRRVKFSIPKNQYRSYAREFHQIPRRCTKSNYHNETKITIDDTKLDTHVSVQDEIPKIDKDKNVKRPIRRIELNRFEIYEYPICKRSSKPFELDEFKIDTYARNNRYNKKIANPNFNDYKLEQYINYTPAHKTIEFNEYETNDPTRNKKRPRRTNELDNISHNSRHEVVEVEVHQSYTEDKFENSKKNKHKRGLERTNTMASQEEHERKIIIEFCHLLEKSKQLFNGLRELPPYGHKQWHVHFGKTFDVYTKLWKFQQQHRELLDTKYGLKRWQIGEIASKIGQLYYHFYLRTSDTAYLNEAYAFYYAIRGRSYYTRACREDRSELMVKKLRYYARFMVVCILLKKVKLVKELIKELSKQIIEYGNIYDPDDEVEWSLVLDEAKAFVRAEPGIAVLNTDNIPVVITHRLNPHSIPPIEIIPQMNLKLQEVLIIGSNSHQVKFSELTMDMFRILQVIEREPTGDMPYLFEEHPRGRYCGVPEPSIPKDDGPPRCEMGNPHKFLLYKPSPNQVMVYLASACDELTANGAVLLYLSAEGHSPAAAVAASTSVASTSTARPVDEGFDTGGLITTSKSDVYRDYNKEPRSAQNKSKEGQCLYAGDLHPFTRKPLFIIIDSDNSFAFQNIPRAFGQPLVILMSPVHPLPALQERRHQGNLFSLFLQAPIAGLAMSCELDSISLSSYDRCQGILSSFMIETNATLARIRLDSNFYPFLGDEFLRTFFFRYIFCEITLRMHRGFRSRANFPKCNPPVPEEIFDKASMVDLMLEIANCLMVRQFFHDTYMAGGNTNL